MQRQHDMVCQQPITVVRASKLKGSLMRNIRGQMVLGVGPDFHAEMWEGGGNLEWGLTAHTEEKSVHIRVG